MIKPKVGNAKNSLRTDASVQSKNPDGSKNKNDAAGRLNPDRVTSSTTDGDGDNLFNGDELRVDADNLDPQLRSRMRRPRYYDHRDDSLSASLKPTTRSTCSTANTEKDTQGKTRVLRPRYYDNLIDQPSVSLTDLKHVGTTKVVEKEVETKVRTPNAYPVQADLTTKVGLRKSQNAKGDAKGSTDTKSFAQATENKNRSAQLVNYNEGAIQLQAAIPNDSKYIHASLIDLNFGCYIAAQGPTKNSAIDFLRMIWQYNVSLVVCLDPLTDKKGCQRYFEFEIGKSAKSTNRFILETYGIIETITPNLMLYEVRITNRDSTGSGNFRRLILLHYSAWTSKENVSASTLFHIIKSVQSTLKLFKIEDDKPIVVHGCNGIRRTGIFITTILLINEIKDTKQISPISGPIAIRRRRYGVLRNYVDYLLVLETCLLCAREQGLISETDENYEETITSSSKKSWLTTGAVWYELSNYAFKIYLPLNTRIDQENFLLGTDVRSEVRWATLRTKLAGNKFETDAIVLLTTEIDQKISHWLLDICNEIVLDLNMRMSSESDQSHNGFRLSYRLDQIHSSSRTVIGRFVAIVDGQRSLCESTPTVVDDDQSMVGQNGEVCISLRFLNCVQNLVHTKEDEILTINRKTLQKSDGDFFKTSRKSQQMAHSAMPKFGEHLEKVNVGSILPRVREVYPRRYTMILLYPDAAPQFQFDGNQSVLHFSGSAKIVITQSKNMMVIDESIKPLMQFGFQSQSIVDFQAHSKSVSVVARSLTVQIKNIESDVSAIHARQIDELERIVQKSLLESVIKVLLTKVTIPIPFAKLSTNYDKSPKLRNTSICFEFDQLY